MKKVKLQKKHAVAPLIGVVIGVIGLSIVFMASTQLITRKIVDATNGDSTNGLHGDDPVPPDGPGHGTCEYWRGDDNLIHKKCCHFLTCDPEETCAESGCDFTPPTNAPKVVVYAVGGGGAGGSSGKDFLTSYNQKTVTQIFDLRADSSEGGAYNHTFPHQLYRKTLTLGTKTNNQKATFLDMKAWFDFNKIAADSKYKHVYAVACGGAGGNGGSAKAWGTTIHNETCKKLYVNHEYQNGTCSSSCSHHDGHYDSDGEWHSAYWSGSCGGRGITKAKGLCCDGSTPQKDPTCGSCSNSCPVTQPTGVFSECTTNVEASATASGKAGGSAPSCTYLSKEIHSIGAQEKEFVHITHSGSGTAGSSGASAQCSLPGTDSCRCCDRWECTEYYSGTSDCKPGKYTCTLWNYKKLCGGHGATGGTETVTISTHNLLPKSTPYNDTNADLDNFKDLTQEKITSYPKSYLYVFYFANLGSCGDSASKTATSHGGTGGDGGYITNAKKWSESDSMCTLEGQGTCSPTGIGHSGAAGTAGYVTGDGSTCAKGNGILDGNTCTNQNGGMYNYIYQWTMNVASKFLNYGESGKPGTYTRMDLGHVSDTLKVIPGKAGKWDSDTNAKESGLTGQSGGASIVKSSGATNNDHINFSTAGGAGGIGHRFTERFNMCQAGVDGASDKGCGDKSTEYNESSNPYGIKIAQETKSNFEDEVKNLLSRDSILLSLHPGQSGKGGGSKATKNFVCGQKTVVNLHAGDNNGSSKTWINLSAGSNCSSGSSPNLEYLYNTASPMNGKGGAIVIKW